MANNGNDTIVKQPSWWGRRSRMEKNLTLLSFIALFLISGLIIALAIVLCSSGADTDYGRKGNSEICMSPGCVSMAANLLKHMDTEADPCDDFYEFACGNFIKTSKIPDDKVSVNTFSAINDELLMQLRNLLEGLEVEGEPRAFQLARRFYKSCMNTTEIERDGISPLLNVVKELGTWPVLEGTNYNEAEFDWIDTIIKFHKMGYSTKYLIECIIAPDIKNSTIRMFSIDQPSLGLNREYLIEGMNEKLVAAYFEYMVDISVLLGADKDAAETELKEALIFEMALANISLPQEKRRDANALYHAYSAADLDTTFPGLPWMKMFNSFLEPHTSLTESDVIVVFVPQYVKDVIALIEKTPKRVQANYVIWRAVKDTISYTNDKLRQRLLVYNGVLAGITANEPKWKECVSTVSSTLSIAIGSMYVRTYFNEKSKETALEMVKDIRNEFRRNLEQVEWMDEATRAAALEKADKIVPHIAYPQELIDNNKINEYYEGLELQPSQFLRSMLNYSKFALDYTSKRLRESVNRTEWSTHGQPAVVNAFYSSIENSIQFPAGILQGDFFSSQRPRYMNYGAVGFIIAHEITHAFDDQGSQFDKDGNLLNWWAEDTKARYLEKAQCIIDQYSNYTAKEVGLNLNGINTQGENIADNAGLKVVYLAYLSWIKRNGEEPTLPGLPYTPKQLFWLSAANIWCSVHRPEALKRQITLGVHAPERFRVLGPMTNMPQFSEDFKCSPEAKMNPKHKCTVW